MLPLLFVHTSQYEPHQVLVIPCRYNRRILSQPCCRNIQYRKIIQISAIHPSSVRLSEAIFHKLSCIPLSQRDFSVTANIHVLSSSRCLSYQYKHVSTAKYFCKPQKIISYTVTGMAILFKTGYSFQTNSDVRYGA